ncbi:rust resistance kinase Lr10-like [Pyrus x bretschneideri]|uniref:rust resistance kinase Lr10-like n=1 Tax=Pyrus x bretschneideri TaxID=225117 RepID=UPI00202E9809|nr:rust resistance kinase Lr10-like [Pyrus x bretschneideri]
MVDSLLLLPAFSLLAIVFSMAINVGPSEAAAYDRAADCPVSNCSDASPLIKFPFRLKDPPLHCGHPEFEVSCLKSKTVIQLSSSSGLFPIQSVDYRSRTFSVYDDEEGCFPRRLLNFIISTTSLFEPIPSQEPMHGGGHHQVLAVRPTASVTEVPFRTCSTLKQLDLPLRRVDDGNSTGYHCFLSTRRSIIMGASLASFVLISAMAAVAVFFHVKQSNRKREKENQLKVERFLRDHKSHVPTRNSYANIKKRTNGFKKKLGEGSFGSVYSGELPTNGVPVAVKVLSDSKGNREDFVNEVGTIGRIHHVNVVRLLGFSAEGGKRALIYKLMQNGSLENFITFKDQSNNTSFDLQKVHNIVNGTAKGIEYLYQGCAHMILHFDIKPHNILLDHDFNPKISGFGLAKLCSKEDSIISMTAARGTVGYIAPEVFSGNFGSVSHKSDGYGFGMLVLEIVGSRKHPALTSGTSEVYFEWVYNCLVQGEALDLKLDTNEDTQIAKKLVPVALWCIQWYPANCLS